MHFISVTIYSSTWDFQKIHISFWPISHFEWIKILCTSSNFVSYVLPFGFKLWLAFMTVWYEFPKRWLVSVVVKWKLFWNSLIASYCQKCVSLSSFYFCSTSFKILKQSHWVINNFKSLFSLSLVFSTSRS